MAATRIIPMHINKGKTITQCLSGRIDYSENPAKTDGGELVSSYECDPKTADSEFLLSKRQYRVLTGTLLRATSTTLQRSWAQRTMGTFF